MARRLGNEDAGQALTPLDQAVGDLQNDADAQKRAFDEALVLYQSKTEGTKYHVALDLTKHHTWEEVLASVADAAKLYNEVPGAWGRILRGMRKFGKSQAVFEAWSALLPGESEYFSILCGGLKLIYGAAARLHDLRHEVTTALEEIPALMATTHKALGLFRDWEAVRAAATHLYVTTLAALEHIVRWFAEKGAKKILKSFFKQDSYEAKLTDKIEDIRTAAEAFEKAMQLASYENIINSRFEIQQNQRLSNQSFGLLLQEAEALKQQSLAQNTALGQNISQQSLAMQQAMQVLLCRVSGLEHIISNFVNSPAPDHFAAQSSMLGSYSAKQLGPGPSSREALPEVARLLLLEGSETSVSAESESRSIEGYPKPSQDRVTAIVRANQFQTWIASPGSSVLFINCNSQSAGSESPSSYICSQLHAAVSKSEGPSLSLVFFCRSHMAPSDPLSGAAGILKSLIYQLLKQFPHLPYRDILHRNTSSVNAVRRLSQALEELVLRLPREIVVFCTIDSVNIHEDSGQAYDEFEEVVESLITIQELCASSDRGFKLLLPCTWNSRRFYTLIRDQKREVIWLPVKVSAHGGLTRTKWEAILQKNLKLLD